MISFDAKVHGPLSSVWHELERKPMFSKVSLEWLDLQMEVRSTRNRPHRFSHYFNRLMGVSKSRRKRA